MFKDIFIEDVGVKDKEKYRDKPESVTGSIDIPFFKNKQVDAIFELPAPKLASLKEAFGESFDSSTEEEDDNAPF
jgi:hypothetical protein